jgi:hypothetical protein
MKLWWLPLAVMALPKYAQAEPTFAYLDRFDHSSRAGGTYTGEVTGDAERSRFDLHAQYVDPESGIGGYLQMPAYDKRNDPFAMGSLELGPTYVRDVNCVNALVFRAGLILPTTTGSPSNETSRLRPTDESLVVHDGAAGRLSISWLLHREALFARADLGIDFVLAEIGAAHVNAGIGYTWTNVLITGELTLSQQIFKLADYGDSFVIDRFHTFAFVGTSIRGTVRGRIEPFAAFLVGISQYAEASITLGVDVRIR